MLSQQMYRNSCETRSAFKRARVERMAAGTSQWHASFFSVHTLQRDHMQPFSGDALSIDNPAERGWCCSDPVRHVSLNPD